MTVIHDLNKEMESALDSRLIGHGGSDFFTMDAFVQAVVVISSIK